MARRTVCAGTVVATTAMATLAPTGCDDSPPPRDSSKIPLASLRGQVAYSRGGDIWTGAADGSNHRRLARRGPEEDPTWSPDRRRLAYRDSRRGINLNDEI